MDEIFNAKDEEAKGRLLKIMQEFLISEAAKHASKEREMGKSCCKKYLEVHLTIPHSYSEVEDTRCQR